MKVGDLVRITRRSIGVPKDAIGLALIRWKSDSGCHVWEVMINGWQKSRRYLEMDLEVISESR